MSKEATNQKTETTEPVVLNDVELGTVAAGCDCFDDDGILHGHLDSNARREAKGGQATSKRT